jgi:hypothetical protein
MRGDKVFMSRLSFEILANRFEVEAFGVAGKIKPMMKISSKIEKKVNILLVNFFTSVILKLKIYKL